MLDLLPTHFIFSFHSLWNVEQTCPRMALVIETGGLIVHLKSSIGNFLMVQWLGLRVQVQSLVQELRSCKLCGAAKKKKIHYSSLCLFHHWAWLQDQIGKIFYGKEIHGNEYKVRCKYHRKKEHLGETRECKEKSMTWLISHCDLVSRKHPRESQMMNLITRGWSQLFIITNQLCNPFHVNWFNILLCQIVELLSR